MKYRFDSYHTIVTVVERDLENNIAEFWLLSTSAGCGDPIKGWHKQAAQAIAETLNEHPEKLIEIFEQNRDNLED